MALTRKEILKRYYIKNRDKLILKHRDYRKDPRNKDKISNYSKKYYQEHKKDKKQWREDHKEYLRITNKLWREKNRQRKREIDKAYHWKNRDKILIKQKIYRDKYRQDNKTKIKLQKRRYNQSIKGKLCSTKFNHKRLAKIHNNGFNLTKFEIIELYKTFPLCIYCGSNKNLQLDHIISLARGGSTSKDNLVISCQKCNTSKGDKDVLEWCKSKGYKIPDIIKQKLNV